MARCNIVGTKGDGIVQKSPEFHFFVTKNIRIGCSSGLIFREEVLKNPVPVLGRKTGGVQFDADGIGNGLGVGQICHGCAVLGAVILVPIFHEQAFNLIALVFQKPGGH